MTFIETVPEDQAQGQLAEIYATEKSSNGFIPNYTRTFGHRPDLYLAWAQLVKTVRSAMDPNYVPPNPNTRTTFRGNPRQAMNFLDVLKGN